MDGERRRYRAFISYSQKDKPVARRLHKALETFSVPKGVKAPDLDAKTRKLGRFFRDDEEMSAASDLGDALRGAIANSDALIVICSPNAADSIWVNREVAEFKRTIGGSRIFAVVVDGTPNAPATNAGRFGREAFPPALRFEVNEDGSVSDRPSEPLAIDLRKEPFGRAKIRLASGLLGLNFDDLWKRNKRRAQTQATIWISASVGLVAAVATAFYLAVSGTAESGRVEAFQQRLEAVIGEAELLSDQIGVDEEGSMGKNARDESRWQAVALTYAFALTAGGEAAAPYFERLGYYQALAFDGYVSGIGKDWNFLLLSPEQGPYTLVSVATGEAIPVTQAPYPLVPQSSDQRWLAVLEDGFPMTVWDILNGKKAWTGEMNEDFVAFSNVSGSVLLLRDDTLVVRSVESGATLSEISLEVEKDSLNAFIGGGEFSKEDTLLHIISTTGDLRTYDLAAQTWLQSIRFPDRRNVNEIERALDGERLLIQTVKLVGDDHVFEYAVVDPRKGAILYDMPPWKCAPQDDGGADCTTMEPIAYAPDGKLLVARDSTDMVDVRVVDLTGASPPRPLKRGDCVPESHSFSDPCGAAAVAVSPTEPIAAVSGNDAVIRIFDLSSGAEIRSIQASGIVLEIDFSSDGRRLIGIGRPRAKPIDMTDEQTLLFVWDVATGRIISRSGDGNSGIEVEQVSKTGSQFIGGNYLDRKTYLWRGFGSEGTDIPGALRRICALRGEQGLMLTTDDADLAPERARKTLDVCHWVSAEGSAAR